jgi:uncharacterized membrane protein YcaP (DUF421 family)
VDTVFRAVATYVILLVIFRAAGKRSLAEITAFDFVLLLIISETTQSALVAGNNSLTNTVILVVTMVGLDIGLSILKGKSKVVESVVDSVPLIILADGVPLPERMAKSRVDEGDVLAAARRLHGLERLDQIKYAVLERNGGISVIPKAGPAVVPPDVRPA